VYSDSSDINPFDYQPGQKLRGKAREDRRPAQDNQEPGIELTSAEKIARTLQEALEPPPPDAVTDLAAIARTAIQAVVDNIQTANIFREPEEFSHLDDLVSSVVYAVRNLLYVTAIPTGNIPSSLLPPGGRDPRQGSQSSPLKPVQRKVTATLSRLVLSARAMQYDSGSQLADTLNRIETDAEELDRAIQSFELEVQRTQHSADPNSDRPRRRMHGVFSTANIGLGLVGAGAAGSWKGLGWVSLENEAAAPKRALESGVVSEIGAYLSQLQDTIAGLSDALRMSHEGAGTLYPRIHSSLTSIVN
jgi:son of sevenless-like protein